MSTTTTNTTGAFDVEAFRRAIHERDAEAQLALYAEDAEIVTIDRTHPPSAPLRLRGRKAIAAHLSDICARDMTHRVERVVAGDDGAAFTEACAYPDGTRVQCAAVLDLVGGRIVRQVGVQAWDE